MAETDPIRKMMSIWGHRNWGFVIYRCTYEDDAQWACFMDILNEWTRQNLEYEGALDLLESLDWSVQESHDFVGARKDDIRRRFREWIKASDGTLASTPRYEQCIMVDQECVESVLNGPQPGDKYGDLDGKGYVYLIDSQATTKQGGQPTPVEERGVPEVGWIKLGLAYVAPRTFNIMKNGGWEGAYVRPPKVALP